MTAPLFATPRRAPSTRYDIDVQKLIEYSIERARTDEHNGDIYVSIPGGLIKGRDKTSDERVPTIWSFGSFFRESGQCVIPATPEGDLLDYVISANFPPRGASISTTSAQVMTALLINSKIAFGLRDNDAVRIVIGEVSGYSAANSDNLPNANPDQTCVVTLKIVHVFMSKWGSDWSEPCGNNVQDLSWLLHRAQKQLQSPVSLHPLTVNQLSLAPAYIRDLIKLPHLVEQFATIKPKVVVPRAFDTAFGPTILDNIYPSGQDARVYDRRGVKVIKLVEYDAAADAITIKVAPIVRDEADPENAEKFSVGPATMTTLTHAQYDERDDIFASDLPVFMSLLNVPKTLIYRNRDWDVYTQSVAKDGFTGSMAIYLYHGFPNADVSKVLHIR